MTITSKLKEIYRKKVSENIECIKESNSLSSN